jgi:hypothetical protein
LPSPPAPFETPASRCPRTLIRGNPFEKQNTKLFGSFFF